MKQWISRITINNLKSFINADVELSSGINVIVGRNNSGKSTILQSVLLLQSQVLGSEDCRKLYDDSFSIVLQYGGLSMLTRAPENRSTQFNFSSQNYQISFINGGQSSGWIACFPPQEPNNLIYPYLSKRKVAAFNHTINSSITSEVSGNFSNLYAKIDRISSPHVPSHSQYIRACKEIIGFQIGTTASSNGKQATYAFGNFEYIPLSSMGEGVANLLGLIVDLCMAEDKVFLIEEPENDIHPTALKGLLNLICEKASNNQFIITTHSNIVLKYLGAYSNNKIFRVDMKFQDSLPTSSIQQIDQSPEEKREVLEDLGYDLYDFDLWSAWLFLEESSAEKIIREYLIPWFTPKLIGKLRTFSARSRDEVPAKFEDFNRLFVFLHLEDSYRNRVWVVIDDGEEEQKIINNFQNKYPLWNPEHFRTWTEHDFESYYPHNFKTKVDEVLSIAEKKPKRDRKKALLEEVEQWIQENPEAAKKEFSESSQDVIEILLDIQKQVCGPRE